MNYALLLLAGTSKRFKNKTPKQFYLIKNKPLYFYPLKALNDNKKIDGIILLTNTDKVMDVFNFVKNNKFNKVKAVIAGGNSRNETVKKGLMKLREFIKKDDIVLIHDSARALIDEETINEAIDETKKYHATTFAMFINDTIIHATDDFIIKDYINRDFAFNLQTPQTFKFNIIFSAYKNSKSTNDDTELVFLNKNKVKLLKGKDKLFKITTIEDINKMETYLK